MIDGGAGGPGEGTTSLREHWDRWHGVVYSGIAAGVMLLAVWLLVYAAMGGLDPRPNFVTYPLRPASEVPVFLAGAMVGTHANCAKLPDHHAVPGDDLVAIRRRLQSQLGFPVGGMRPGDGWVFKGAALCKVGHHPAAHLLSARGPQAVSIFSLPARATYQASSGSSYQSELNGCVMSGVVEGNGLYCVVASGLGSAKDCPTIHQVNDFRDALLASLSDGFCTPDSDPAPAPAATPTVHPVSH